MVKSPANTALITVFAGFDVRLNGYNYRKLADKSDEQIWGTSGDKKVYGKED